MIKNYFSLLFLFISVSFSYGQVVINELDSDTPGIDDKEFVELKSAVPNFSLDGYVLVFFNGNPESASTGNKSYLTISLNGLTTDANGLVVIGSNGVSPVPQKIIADNLIQNGADAVAVYQGTAANFPDGTLATTANLIDALAYDTNDADATALMALLGLTIQINEDENNQGVNQSIQRKPDGTYEVKAPTPGANNDGSGILLNGVRINVPVLQYTEGDSFVISFTTQTPVTSDLAFTYTLTNGSFTAADFSANTNVLIPTGSTTFQANVQLIDDAIDEGDELMKIKLGNLPAGYVRLNDNIEVRIIDNDFTVAAWGTPLNPTHGVVTSTAPAGYYDSLEGKSGAQLKQAVQDIIANPAVVRAHNYGDITNILKVADQNPLNSNEVWLMYKEVSRSKFLFQDTGSGTGRWNREHIYPQSRGGFTDGTSDTPDGINVWEPSSAAMLNHGHADAHHLRAEDGPENSSRNNKDYGLTDYNGFSGNAGSWKGDVARAVFYMSVRYNGLDVVNGNPPDSTVGQLGDLATLLQWNVNDPSDDFEMNRNNYIYTWQQNRNPFIDYPYLADYIWGSRAGEAFSLSTPDFSELKVAIYPNPAKDRITIAGINNPATLQLFSVSGQQLLTADFSGPSDIQLNLAPGMYLAKIISEGRTAVRKIVIQ